MRRAPRPAAVSAQRCAKLWTTWPVVDNFVHNAGQRTDGGEEIGNFIHNLSTGIHNFDKIRAKIRRRGAFSHKGQPKLSTKMQTSVYKCRRAAGRPGRRTALGGKTPSGGPARGGAFFLRETPFLPCACARRFVLTRVLTKRACVCAGTAGQKRVFGRERRKTCPQPAGRRRAHGRPRGRFAAHFFEIFAVRGQKLLTNR